MSQHPAKTKEKQLGGMEADGSCGDGGGDEGLMAGITTCNRRLSSWVRCLNHSATPPPLAEVSRLVDCHRGVDLRPTFPSFPSFPSLPPPPPAPGPPPPPFCLSVFHFSDTWCSFKLGTPVIFLHVFLSFPYLVLRPLSFHLCPPK